MRGLFLVLAILTPLGFAHAHFVSFDSPGNLLDPFTDANTYRAAGERLNDDHNLYALQPGDRDVLVIPHLFTAALVSPPPIAVIWRPIAAMPLGYEAWIAACWLALLGTVAYLILRAGPWAALLAVVLSFPIGQSLAVGNVNCLLPAALVASWRFRDSPWIGLPLGAIAAVKLAPVSMIGWLVAESRWRALVVLAVTVAGIGAMSLIGAGVESLREYLIVVPTLQATPLSLSGETGIGWLTYAALASGTTLAALLRHRPALAFRVSVVTVILGSPVVHWGSFAVLLALAAPLIPRATQAAAPSADRGVTSLGRVSDART